MSTNFLIFLLVVCLVCALASAGIAASKGRRAGGWFLYGLLFPPIGLVHASILEPTEASLIAYELKNGRMKHCPECLEPVSVQAKRCKHCGSPLG